LSLQNTGIDYYVKKGDSLYSIAKKNPGITISDIKSGTILMKNQTRNEVEN
jgi:LysM repeat protein